MPRFLFLIVVALSFSIGAVSQTAQPSCSTAIGNFVTQSPVITRTGIGTPYSLTATIKTEMKLYDGNTISGFTTSRQARDSQGRTRVENPSVCPMDKDHQPHWQGSITVIDPVAKTRTLWQESLTPAAKIATVTHVPSVNIPIPRTAQEEYGEAKVLSQASDHASLEAKRYNQQFKAEDLGKRNIAGLEASGLRITRTSPVGMLGNSLPLTYVEEKWISDEYGIIVLDINDDPILGKSTYEVNNFTRAEPDASLFQPPADYKVNERTVTQ
jgi:hypothetical protein